MDRAVCWVISDGRRGIENQALGLAEACARIRPLAIHAHIINHNAAFKAMTPRLQFALKSKPEDYGLPRSQSGGLPEFAIGCGRQAVAPLMALKAAKPDIFTAYVQAPPVDPSRFDVVFAPEHDGLSGSNVHTMIGSPNRVTNELIIGQTLSFGEKLMSLPMPRAAMLIGGPSKTHKFTKADHAGHMAAATQLLALGHSLLITPSRRTPDWAVEDYKRLASDHHEKVWLYDGDGENPYYAFLGGADVILVTEESTNMLTEACATGKPVFRLPLTGDAGKFQKLYDALGERCNLHAFDGKFNAAPYPALDETVRIAELFWAQVDARSAVMN